MNYWWMGLWIWIGLTVGNYGYQWLNGKEWSKASERSYYEALPIVVFTVCLYIN